MSDPWVVGGSAYDHSCGPHYKLDHQGAYPTFEEWEADRRLIASIPMMRSRIKALEAAALDALSSLTAAVSLLERGGKKAAPSDKMFTQMLIDYNGAIERARNVLIQGSDK